MKTLTTSFSSTWLFLSLATILLNSNAWADGIVVVEGKPSGYIHNPTSEQQNAAEEISLHLIKEGGFIDYSIESDPPGLLCDEGCEETVQRLPSGTVSLKISGNKPFPLLEIPLRGIWKEGCDGNTTSETEHCIMRLNQNNAKVIVEVNPNVEAGTLFPLPGTNTEVMLIAIDIAHGYLVVAAHEKVSSSLTWLDFDPSDPTKHKNININSWDGAANSAKLLALDSAAARYCNDLGSQISGKWHLPSKVELLPLTQEALKKIPSIEPDNRFWSSTQNFFSDKDHYRLAVNARAHSSGDWDNERYVYTYDKQTLQPKENNSIRRHQVLCVTHLPL